MKIQIKSIMGSLLFEGDFSCLSDAVSVAVKKHTDLSYANLSSANLRSADLSYANLSSADLRSTDLSYADLRYANLSSANLSYADLRYANLSSANLSYADLSYANLSSANLRSADLSYANLSSADLRSANLRSADLRYANLSSANLSYADLSYADGAAIAVAKTRILPEGDIVGWKKCQSGTLVKLLIPKKAKRSHAFGRKCRAEFVKVLEVVGAKEAKSIHDGTVYVAGKTVKPKCQFDENWMKECASGIHFFITREEAEEYN